MSGTDLASRDTLAVFTVAPSPELGRRLSHIAYRNPAAAVPVGRLGRELQVFLMLGADPVLSLLESGSVPEYSVKLQPNRIGSVPVGAAPTTARGAGSNPASSATHSRGSLSDLPDDIGTARRAACAISFPATDFAAGRNKVAARRSRNMEHGREQRQQQNEHFTSTPSRAPELQLLQVRVNRLT